VQISAKSLRAIVVSAVILFLCLGGAAASADDAAQAAARIAEQEHGGRVLKVERKEGAYRVKLLQASGKVKIVRVRDPKKKGDSPGNESASADESKKARREKSD
jgi:hypothetical protein